MLSVLIVIVTYNGMGHIRNCLTPLKKLPEGMKCLVIDNASTDGTPELIKHYYLHIELIENSKNLGFGAANNIGLRKAIEDGYDYVYLLNQDAWIDPEDILKLVDIAEKNPEYGIISPMQVYAGKKSIDNNFSLKVTKEMMDDFLLSSNMPKELYLIKGRSIQAAHWLVPTQALRKVGGFSPTFFHYGEDDNLCRRMEFHGFKLGIAPNILAVHNRENRKITSAHQLLLRKNELKKIVSDPFLSNKAVYKSILKAMFFLLIDYKISFFTILLDFVKNYHRIRKTKKISVTQMQAFLNLNTIL